MNKKQLIEKRGHKCERCGNESWLDNPIPLEIHHVSPPSECESDLQLLCPNCHAMTSNYRGRGIRTAKSITDDEIKLAVEVSDNIRQVLLNLKLVAKGGNYDVIRQRVVGLGLKDKFVKPKDEVKDTLCLHCGMSFVSDDRKFCSVSCSAKFHYQNRLGDIDHPTKIDWPSVEVLNSMTKQFGFSEAGRRLGVSDNAIRKRLKNHTPG